MMADYRFLRACGAGRIQAICIAIRRAPQSRGARKARKAREDRELLDRWTGRGGGRG